MGPLFAFNQHYGSNFGGKWKMARGLRVHPLSLPLSSCPHSIQLILSAAFSLRTIGPGREAGQIEVRIPMAQLLEDERLPSGLGVLVGLCLSIPIWIVLIAAGYWIHYLLA